MKITSFTDLDVWKKGREIRIEIYKLCKTLPREEKFVLIDQMKRAAISVTANIAEGFGRYHFKENIQFLRMARGSLYELLDHLITCKDQNFIKEESFKKIEDIIYTNIKMINQFIKYLNGRENTKGN
ncbi:S23 ribosomal protein [Caldithrix abyssi DSM 13497]|uniref:S23 ribosomal protein n=1 Tax=Caldithrix abyssi DSM 13497 TaxID=880073 RepID=H1XS77_CALAY|nr:four helix bundle protein [Caldithrix abyssi]EHO40241.1 S23 ribosomal protein [Caldithrix abyssi DSM 13497]